MARAEPGRRGVALAACRSGGGGRRRGDGGGGGGRAAEAAPSTRPRRTRLSSAATRASDRAASRAPRSSATSVRRAPQPPPPPAARPRRAPPPSAAARPRSPRALGRERRLRRGRRVASARAAAAAARSAPSCAARSAACALSRAIVASFRSTHSDWCTCRGEERARCAELRRIARGGADLRLRFDHALLALELQLRRLRHGEAGDRLDRRRERRLEDVARVEHAVRPVGAAIVARHRRAHRVVARSWPAAASPAAASRRCRPPARGAAAARPRRRPPRRTASFVSCSSRCSSSTRATSSPRSRCCPARSAARPASRRSVSALSARYATLDERELLVGGDLGGALRTSAAPCSAASADAQEDGDCGDGRAPSCRAHVGAELARGRRTRLRSPHPKVPRWSIVGGAQHSRTPAAECRERSSSARRGRSSPSPLVKLLDAAASDALFCSTGSSRRRPSASIAVDELGETAVSSTSRRGALKAMYGEFFTGRPSAPAILRRVLVLSPALPGTKRSTHRC